MVARPTEILVVDDEADIRELLVEAVSYDGNRCASAADGVAAFRLLRRRPFDIILSDIAMPELDGMALLAKARWLRPEVKVILITGFGSSQRAKEAIQAGAFDYLEKPFDLNDVRRAVDAARAALRAEIAGVAPDGEPSPAPDPPPQRDPLTGLLTLRYFREELARLRAVCRRQHSPLSVLLVDVDGFSAVNEAHGHAVGDLLLRALSERLLDTSRTRDVLARYRWDEFVMALPETDVEAALRVAGRCCQAAQHCNFTFEGQEIAFSVSAGVAECETGFIESEADLLRRAEGALARAKLRSGPHVARWSPGPDDATQAATTLQADETSLEQMAGRFRSLEHQLRQTCLESTRALVAAVEAKEPLTERHSMNVATYCATLANRMNVRPALVESLQTAATLHDIGKIGVPDAVLNKAGRLTDDEFALIKQHPAMGVRILEHASFLRAELPMILHHHERWDGRGYPGSLAGKSIPLGARILHAADAMDAMFSPRSYKNGYPVEKVQHELKAGRGTQFDPDVADAALAWLAECPEEIIYPDPSAAALEPVRG